MTNQALAAELRYVYLSLVNAITFLYNVNVPNIILDIGNIGYNGFSYVLMDYPLINYDIGVKIF